MVTLTDRLDMAIVVYRGRKTITQQQQVSLLTNYIYSSNLKCGFDGHDSMISSNSALLVKELI